MRKRIYGKKLARRKDAKRALLTGLVRALVRETAIETSEARAKALKSFVDKIISTAKKGGISARRLVVARLRGDKETAGLIFEKILPGVKNQKSGFTRIVRLGTRRGDRSERVRIEWTIEEKPTTNDKQQAARSDPSRTAKKSSKS